MYSEDFINHVKNTIDLVDLVSRYTKLEKEGTHIYMGRCPNPRHNDSDPSFVVQTTPGEPNSWRCFGCHNGEKNINRENNSSQKLYGTDCIAFYMWIEQVNFKTAMKDLCSMYNITMPESKFDFLYRRKHLQTNAFQSNMYEYPKQYLYNRGLTDEDITKWRIGFDGQKIVFPLIDRYKNVLGFTKRWIHMPQGRKDKYKNSCNSGIFNKSSYFYGIQNLDIDFKEIRITEGTMDVILANKYGVKNVVATLGTSFTREHAQIIKNLGMTPVFIMDGDSAGKLAAEKAIELLNDCGIYSKILTLPAEMDLCDFSLKYKGKTESYIDLHSLTYGFYKTERLLLGFDSKIAEIKMQYKQEFMSIISELPNKNEQAFLLQYIQSRIKLTT